MFHLEIVTTKKFPFYFYFLNIFAVFERAVAEIRNRGVLYTLHPCSRYKQNNIGWKQTMYKMNTFKNY